MKLTARDYDSNDNAASAGVTAVALLCAVVAVVSVALRFLSRRMKRLHYGPDDWLILLALIFLLGHNATLVATIYLGGVGYGGLASDESNYAILYRSIILLQLLFGVSLGLTKASILYLLMRIFTTRQFKLLARIVLGFVVCWVLMCVLIVSTMCRPFKKNWDRSVPGTCGDMIPAHISIATTDIVGDILIALLPIPSIWKLQINIQMKIGLIIIFAVTCLDVVVSVLRIKFLVDLATDKDYNFATVNEWIWSSIEPALGIVLACLPTLRPLLEYVRIKMKNSHSSHDRSGSTEPSRSYNFNSRESRDRSSREVGFDGQRKGEAWAITEMKVAHDTRCKASSVTSSDTDTPAHNTKQEGISVDREFVVGSFEPAEVDVTDVPSKLDR